MKKFLQFILIIFTITTAISLNISIYAQAKTPYTFDGTYTSDNPLKPGSYNLKLTESSTHTLFVFKPDEIGIYEFTVDDSATVGWWGAYPAGYVRNPNSETNVIQREIKKVGDVAVIGISSSKSNVNLSITKTGTSEGIVNIQYIDYVNEHTPVNNIYPSDELLGKIDISKPHTAVLCSDGFYRLDSEYGPVLYADLYTAEFSLMNAYGSYGALTMRGQCDGVYYNFKSAMKEYNDVLSGTSGVYPLTIDLIRFIQSYGVSQMWFKPEFSPFKSIQEGTADPDTAWMALCLISTDPLPQPLPVSVWDTDKSSPFIIDFVTESQTAGTPISYIINNKVGNCKIKVTGTGTFTVTYSGNTYPSVNSAVIIENVNENAQINIDGAGVFTLEINIHTACEKNKVNASSPSHTTPGNSEYWYCSICDKKYDSAESDANILADSEIIIPPTGHIDSLKHSAVAESCSNNGNIEYYYCQKCNANFDNTLPTALKLTEDDITIPASDHNWSNYHSYTDEYHIRECNNCNEKQTAPHRFADDSCTVCNYYVSTNTAPTIWDAIIEFFAYLFNIIFSIFR